MNQIEMEKIADTFDRNRSGNIDLSEIMTVLKGSKSWTRVPTLTRQMTDSEKIDHEVQCIGIAYVYMYTITVICIY